jgi:outer membrane protein TolC
LEYGDAFSLGYDLSRSSYNFLSGSTTTESPTTYGAGFSLSYSRPLARGAGRYQNLIPRYISSNNLALSYDKLDDDIRKLKKSVMDIYFQAVAARRTIAVREAALEVALKQLERAVERYKVGLAIQADVLQAENSVLNQRSTLLSARAFYKSLLDQLTTLAGVPVELELAVDSDGTLIDLGSSLPEDLWELVQENSYELKSLGTQLANLRLSRDQLLNRRKDNLNLSVSYSRTGEDETLARSLAGYENENYNVGLSWSLQPGERSTEADLAQTELDLASLELQIQDTDLQLKSALRNQQRDLQTKYDQIQLAQSSLEVLQETYEILVARYEVGLGTNLDVVEAQENVLAGELSLLQARVAYQETYREIQLLAGLI